MMRRAALLLAVVLAPACRSYDYHDRVSRNDGLTPGDQFARYGREQAQAVAIARQFAAEGRGSSPEDLARRTEAFYRRVIESWKHSGRTGRSR